jgi:hypothetical protein
MKYNFKTILNNRWKPVAAFRKVGGLLNKFLFKQTPVDLLPLHFDCKPVQQLERIAHHEYKWRSSGTSPYFVLTDKNSYLIKGWYKIELCINATQPVHCAKLYFDYGEGFEDKDCIILMCKKNRPTKRVFYLREKPEAIRFYPLELKDDFEIEYLRFSKAAKFFAVNRMLRKLHLNVEEFKDVSMRDIKAKISDKADSKGIRFIDCLADYYNDVFDHQYHALVARRYEQWIDRFETPEFNKTPEIHKAIAEFKYKPLISLVMCAHNTQEEFLRSGIDSVLRQSYQRWELCIADNASSNGAVNTILQEYAINDPRIKPVFNEIKGNISEVFNNVLDLASGDYIALLDHEAMLSDHALYFVQAP